LIMKGSTSLRRFCWLQVNFSYGPSADHRTYLAGRTSRPVVIQ
jgi:hypothetical protein